MENFIEWLNEAVAKWVKCSKCGKEDRTVPGHVGTKRSMQCRDCCLDPNLPGSEVSLSDTLAPWATMCRDCCPTGHGTHGDDMDDFAGMLRKAAYVAGQIEPTMVRPTGSSKLSHDRDLNSRVWTPINPESLN